MPLKKILLIMIGADIVLGFIAYFVVFYSTPGTYDIANSPIPTTSYMISSSSLAFGSSTASSTGIPTASSTISFGGGSGNNANYNSDFSLPYPINWAEGTANLSIMGASLQGSQLTLKVAVAIGNTMSCVPLNIRMLVDEQGDLAAPINPQFTFPETDSCTGAPGATYTDQEVVFDVNSAALPLFFTTGGASNIFFTVQPTTSGGLNVSRVSTNG